MADERKAIERANIERRIDPDEKWIFTFFTPLKFSTGPCNIHTPRIATLVPLERESARS